MKSFHLQRKLRGASRGGPSEQLAAEYPEVPVDRRRHLRENRSNLSRDDSLRRLMLGESISSNINGEESDEDGSEQDFRKKRKSLRQMRGLSKAG